MTLPDSDSPAAAFVLTAVLGLATWLWNKATGKKTDDVKTLARGIVDQAIHLFVTAADQHPEDIRDKALDYAWRGLAKAGIPRNAATELLVRGLVEQAIAAGLAELRKRDHLRDVAIAANAAIAQGELAKQTKIQADHAAAMADIAKIQPPDDVTIVAP